jgi:hypothetical protein
MLLREVLPEVEEPIVKGKEKKSKEEILIQPVDDSPKHDLINYEQYLFVVNPTEGQVRE